MGEVSKSRRRQLAQGGSCGNETGIGGGQSFEYLDPQIGGSEDVQFLKWPGRFHVAQVGETKDRQSFRLRPLGYHALRFRSCAFVEAHEGLLGPVHELRSGRGQHPGSEIGGQGDTRPQGSEPWTVGLGQHRLTKEVSLQADQDAAISYPPFLDDPGETFG